MNCYNCGFSKLVCDTQKDGYVCQKCGYEHKKQYFFISHSHRDIEKVRIVRNVIEETFFYEPIMFFLKCLSNEQEINDLIRREIYERIWFVYCKSKNAEQSKYVQFERDYIKKLVASGKKINVFEVDLDKFEIWDEECANYIREQIEYKVRKSQIFLCYSRSDTCVAKEISKALKQREFNVFSDFDSLNSSSSWLNQVESVIKQTSYNNGAVLALCSQRAIDSPAFIQELTLAFNNGALVIPLVISNDNPHQIISFLTQNFSEFLGEKAFKMFAVSENKIEQETEKLVKYLLNY